MISQYIAIPKSSHAVVEVATTTSLKTVLQVATPSTQQIELVRWGVYFDASAAAAPGVVDLIDTNVTATVTSLTPEVFGYSNEPASLCVGGSSATGYNASAEGTITASRIIDAENNPPTSGYSWDWPQGERPVIAVSRFLRIRCLFAATVNVIPFIVWQE